MTLTNRRFPPPWSVEDTGAAFVVKDGGGQKLAYVYYEEEPGRRSSATLLTRCRNGPCSERELMWLSSDR